MRRSPNSRILFIFTLLLTLAVGCQKKKPDTQDGATATAKNAKLPLVIPDNVVAYGGIDSVEQYLKKATKLAQAATPTAPPARGRRSCWGR